MAVINQKTGKFLINGVAVTDPQLPHKFQINTTGVYHRTMNATREGYPVANMKKLFWKYNRLTKSQLTEILNIILPVLEAESDEFDVTAEIDGIGSVTDRYYIGQPFEWEKDTPTTYKMEIHFIQVRGKIKL